MANRDFYKMYHRYPAKPIPAKASYILATKFHKLLGILLLYISNALATPVQASTSKTITKVLSHKDFDLSLTSLDQGVSLIQVSSGKQLFSLNPKKPLIAASTTKLITAAALLDKLGATKTFKTKIYIHGKLSAGKLTGDLIIQGCGDPYMTNEQLYELSRQVYSSGVHSVTGNLIVDHGRFVSEGLTPYKPQNKKLSSHAYDAKVTAFSTNFNTFNIHIRPGMKVGTAAHVQLYPFNSNEVKIHNRVQTHPSRTKLFATRHELENGNTEITVTGQIAIHKKPIFIYRSMANPARDAARTALAHLKGAGIQMVGGIKLAPTPHEAKPLLEVKGHDLAKLLKGLNWYSNNFIADSLVHILGAETNTNQQPTYNLGLKAINHFVTSKVGIPLSHPIISGSGLDPHNRLSAESLTQILVYMAQRHDLFPEFLASLAIAGKSGTLKDRFDSRSTSPLRGMVRAKTGTLTSPVTVSALAGYIYTKKHGMVAFSILQNGKTPKVQPTISTLHLNQEKSLIKAYRKL